MEGEETITGTNVRGGFLLVGDGGSIIKIINN